MKKLLKNKGVQSFLASILCIIVGLLIGFIVLLFINPSGAWEAICNVVMNFFTYSRDALRWKNFGNTLVKTAPLLMCSLSILFCYKVGLFNIGAAGQYVAGSCACLYAALAWGWGWFPCILLAIVVSAVFGLIVGLLKAYCNVNEVISGIMLNWIGLYTSNMLLSQVKEEASPYTLYLSSENPSAILPSLGLDSLFGKGNKVTIAIPIAIAIAVIILIILNMTKLGFELKATGLNKNAAKYAGMAEKRNIILTLIIGGVLAGLGGALLYLTDSERWLCTASSVPGMGFNGIAAAFLGGLNPIGAIFSSYFIQHISSGGAHVDLKMYSSQISDLIASIIIYLCGFVFFVKYALNLWLAKKDSKKDTRFTKEEIKAVEEAQKKADDTQKGGEGV